MAKSSDSELDLIQQFEEDMLFDDDRMFLTKFGRSKARRALTQIGMSTLPKILEYLQNNHAGKMIGNPKETNKMHADLFMGWAELLRTIVHNPNHPNSFYIEQTMDEWISFVENSLADNFGKK